MVQALRARAVISLAILLLVAQLGASLDLLALGGARAGAGIPPGWKVRPVRGQSAPVADIRREGDQSIFRVTGAGRAAWFYRELSPDLGESPARLHWSWRVLEAPAGADLRAESSDDAPIRVYVVFGKPGRLFGGSGRIIFYSYGNMEPAGFSAASHGSDKVHVIRVDGAGERGAWQEHIGDPFADYRRIWRRDPPQITAIGIMQDTDQTRERAVAELRQLAWRSP